MELLIAAVVLIFLVKSGALSSISSLGSTFASNGQQLAPAPTGMPLNPSQENFALAGIGTQTQEINQGINVATTAVEDAALKLGVKAGSAFAQAIPIVGQAVAAVADILMAQHTARLKGAIEENKIIPTVTQAFDADIQQIVGAYNSKQATAQMCIQAIHQMDSSLYAFMKSNATGPGRAWRECNSSNGCYCNKSCTAECCVYWGNFYPAFHGGSFSEGIIPTLQLLNGMAVDAPPALNGQPSKVNPGPSESGIVHIPAVMAPSAKYGNFNRGAYSVTFGR